MYVYHTQHIIQFQNITQVEQRKIPINNQLQHIPT